MVAAPKIPKGYVYVALFSFWTRASFVTLNLHNPQGALALDEHSVEPSPHFPFSKLLYIVRSLEFSHLVFKLSTDT